MSAHPAALRPFVLTSGTVELLKWLALGFMVIDHANASLYGRQLGTLADALGRIAFPLFAVVLAYNLARPGADLGKAARRLFAFGALTLPVHAYLFAQLGGWWPLNIMFTFAVAVGVIAAFNAGRVELALAALLFGGALVEYWWPGVFLVVACWFYFTRPSRLTLPGVVLAALALCIVNGNFWALLAIPVIGCAQIAQVDVPRLRWFFWWFYPLHLAALLLLTL